MGAAPPPTLEDVAALLVDLDGVLTKTAVVHAAAWKQLFDEFLAGWSERERRQFEPFDAIRDYRAHVNGKPRYEGVRSVLVSRGISLPYGSPDDPPEADTVCGLGNRKNAYFNRRLAEDGVELFYLFSAEELRELLERLGYPLEPDAIPRTIDYYRSRTSHGSTLGWVVDSWVLARSDRPGSWEVLAQALESDVADLQGGTTPEGVHLGAMAGTVDIVQRCYTGIETRGDILRLQPRLPRPLRHLRLRVQYRGHAIQLDLTHERVGITSLPSAAGSIKLALGDESFELAQGESREFPAANRPDPATAKE
jgi:hypothetical protein